MKPLTSLSGPVAGSHDYALTASGLENLRAELFALRERRGTRHYQAGEEEDLALDARIANIEDVLSRAWVVDPQALATGTVQIGTEVVVQDLDSDISATYRVVGKHEPLRRGELSAASAVGMALLGKAIGDEVEVELPNGTLKRLRIDAYEPAHDD